MMNDKKVIKRFTKKWTSDGNRQSPGPDKDIYFPPKDLMLDYYLEEEDGEFFAKVTVSTNKPFPPKDAMENARFYVFGDTLVSTPMLIKQGNTVEKKPDLKVIETLELNSDEDEMIHKLAFSDIKYGRWICKV